MLHVIFIILKIIGIVLGVLLALLLFLVGIILFVPVRYHVYASKYDTIHAKARVSWLFRIVSLRFRYYSEEETYTYCLRIFGYPFIDSNRPTKVKKIKKEKVKEDKDKAKKIKVKKVKVKKVKLGKTQARNTKAKKNKEINRDNKQVAIKLEDKQTITTKNDSQREITSEKAKQFEDQIDDNEETIEYNSNVYGDIQQEKKDIIKPHHNEHTNMARNVDDEELDEDEQDSFFCRITKPIKAIFQRIKDIFFKIREGLHSIRNIFSNIKTKIHLLREFLEVEDNRRGIGRVYAGLKKTLRHIIPYKVKGVVRIGLDDPCSTGYLLGALSMMYPIYADKIQIIPDFQEEVLEGQVNAKGRIRAFTLLIIGIKLFLDENFKTLLKNVKELKEEL